jgi:hypothetical protein
LRSSSRATVRDLFQEQAAAVTFNYTIEPGWIPQGDLIEIVFHEHVVRDKVQLYSTPMLFRHLRGEEVIGEANVHDSSHDYLMTIEGNKALFDSAAEHMMDFANRPGVIKTERRERRYWPGQEMVLTALLKELKINVVAVNNLVNYLQMPVIERIRDAAQGQLDLVGERLSQEASKLFDALGGDLPQDWWQALPPEKLQSLLEIKMLEAIKEESEQ